MSKPSWKKPASPLPRAWALEARLMFDAAAVADVVQKVTEAQPLVDKKAVAEPAPAAEATAPHAPAAAHAPAVQEVLLRFPADTGGLASALETAGAQVKQLLTNFMAQEGAVEQLFARFNGGQDKASAAWVEAAQTLRQDIAEGRYGVQVSFVSEHELAGTMAAFSRNGLTGQPLILLNRDWAAETSVQGLVSVLLEEVGHSLDARLNGTRDTPGDEGERFAAALLGGDPDRVGADNDHATLMLEGQSLELELASYTFVNAYRVNTATTPAGKEANSLDFVFTGTQASVQIDDNNFNSRNFSGNDVSVVALKINGVDYYGWISRPIKSGGVVKGFYFWTDNDFTSLQAAQTDGNQDGDGNVADNVGFVLVVDQAYFNSLGGTQVANTLKNVGSSSDRVDSALNALILQNKSPTAVADTANATEAGVDTGGNYKAGVDPSGNVLTNDTDPDTTNEIKRVVAVGTTLADQVIGYPTTSTSRSVTGLYGSLTMDASGNYSYVVDNSNSAVEALRQSSNTLSDTFTYRMVDKAGAASTTTLKIVIKGENDAPQGKNDYNTAKESLRTTSAYAADDPLGSQATGNVLNNDTDKDKYGETKAVAAFELSGSATGSSQGTASFNVTMDGSNANSINLTNTYYVYRWNGSAATALYASDGTTRITVATKTGNGQTVSFTFSSSTSLQNSDKFALSTSSDASNLGSSVYTGTVNSTTNPSSATVVLSAPHGSIATGMTVGGTGLATAPTVSAVNYDAVTNQIVSVTLSSQVAIANQALTFRSTGTVGNTLVGQYGTLQLKADGSYTYTPTANNPNLNQGQSAVETFNYTMQDAATVSSAATLSITVFGSTASDPNAVADTVTAVEAGGTNNSAGTNPVGSGTTGGGPLSLLANDTTSTTLIAAWPVTTNAETSVPASTGGVTDSGYTTYHAKVTGLYGTLYVRSNGDYTYVVDNNNADVQALRDSSQTLTETFNYKIQNNSSLKDVSTLTVTIQGANDAPVASADTATATEAGGLNNALSGYDPGGNVLANDTDIDDLASELSVTAIRTGSIAGAGTAGTLGTALRGSYGWLTLNADGSWTYTVDNTNLAVNQLRATDVPLSDEFLYTVRDRGVAVSGFQTAAAVLTIKIQGEDDWATIGPATDTNNDGLPDAAQGAVTEDLNVTAGALTAGGTLSVSDLDAGQAKFSTIVTPMADAWGTLTISEAGAWSYSVDNTLAALQALQAGETRTETFTVLSADGSALQT
ncbi:VCBS domain-containing protein, partial [Azohydromonas lata]|uniref:VCBS domain-containing protein n=1 Tax=Azohydromonas lata TaxID=45677 RepID=UPI000B28ECC9